MMQTKFSFVELVAQLDARGILITTNGKVVYFDVPKGVYWDDLHVDVLYYKPALIDVANQRN